VTGRESDYARPYGLTSKVWCLSTYTRPKKSGKGSPRSRANAHVNRETDASDENSATRPFQQSMSIRTVAPAVEPVAWRRISMTG